MVSSKEMAVKLYFKLNHTFVMDVHEGVKLFAPFPVGNYSMTPL